MQITNHKARGVIFRVRSSSVGQAASEYRPDAISTEAHIVPLCSFWTNDRLIGDDLPIEEEWSAFDLALDSLTLTLLNPRDTEPILNQNVVTTPPDDRRMPNKAGAH